MKHAHHPESDTTFLRRTGDFGRRHWQAAVVSVVLSTITGTVVPMLQSWHDERKQAEALEAVRADLQHDIDILDAKVFELQKQQNNAHYRKP